MTTLSFSSFNDASFDAPTPSSALFVIQASGELLAKVATWLDPSKAILHAQNIEQALTSQKKKLQFDLLPQGNAAIFLPILEDELSQSQKTIKFIRSVASATLSSHLKTAYVLTPELEANKHFESADLHRNVGYEFQSGAYRYLDELQPSDVLLKKRVKVENIHYYSKIDANTALTLGKNIALGANISKRLGDLPSNICDANFICAKVEEIVKTSKKLSFKILGEDDLKQENMHCFLSVGKGSSKESKLVEFHYKNADVEPTVLVGKGITFDTGGISLKPGAGMDEMKYDMCGAASVVGTIAALAKSEAKVHVIGLLALAENMPSGNATRPGDVVLTKSGQTVEILNTDAEGRLVLCDTLTYSEKFNPHAVVDIATLTGAAVIALGGEVTALYTEDEDLQYTMLETGIRTGDRVWPMPLYDEYEPKLKSKFADLANIGGREAGSVTAAVFLKRFTKNLNWAHLDIAGSAWNSGSKGSTGRPVHLLTEYCLSQEGSTS